MSGRKDLGNGALLRCLYPCLRGDLKAAIGQARLTHNNELNEDIIQEYFEMVQTALEGGGKGPEIDSYPGRPSGHIQNTMNWVKWWISTTDSFADSIIGPVNEGGDADTIAAITGGVSGAIYGFRAIPNQWVQALDPLVTRELDLLVDKAL